MNGPHPAWPALASFIRAGTTPGALQWHGRLADPHDLTPAGAYRTVWVCPHRHRRISAAQRCAVAEGRRRFGLTLPCT